MGQKINPTGFRVGVNKGWKSLWYSDDDGYKDLLQEDLKVRKFVQKKLYSAGVHTVKIKRFMNKILIEIVVARPGVVIGRGGAGIEELKNDLDKKINGNVEIKILEVKNPDTSAKIIAKNVAEQIERRIAPKIAMARELEKAKNTGLVKGVRIWIAGRIRGAEIARTEKKQWGTIPLQTLRADIDYALIHAQVPNAGRQGVRVWVYKGEVGASDKENEKE